MAPRKIVAGKLVLYPDSKVNKALWNGVRVPLTPRDFQLLLLLEPGTDKGFARAWLQEEMKRKGFSTSLTFMVREVRLAFRKVDPSFDQLVMLYKFGYGWETY